MQSDSSLTQGWKIFKQSYRVLVKYPLLALPLFITWAFGAAITLITRYSNINISFIGVFVIVFLLAYSLTLSCLLLLEFLQQIETGQRLSLAKALGQLFSQDAIKAIPVALVWAVFWFIILVLKALRRRDGGKGKPSMADAGRTLSGMNSPFSWFGLGLDMLEKLIRMVIFSMLPAIAWEGKSPWAAMKKGSSVVRRHPVQFLSNYGLTLAAGLLMALPLIPIYLLDKSNVALPSFVWLLVIIYSGIIWTIEVYLEELSTALLYMWNLKWEEKGGVGDLASVPAPNLLSDTSYLENPTTPSTSVTTVSNPSGDHQSGSNLVK